MLKIEDLISGMTEETILQAALNAVADVEGWCDEHNSWNLKSDNIEPRASTKLKRAFRYRLRLKWKELLRKAEMPAATPGIPPRGGEFGR